MAKITEVILAFFLLLLAHEGSSQGSLFDDLYPFGVAVGDTEFDVENSAAATIVLPINVVFFGQSLGSIFINPFGVVSFISFVNQQDPIPFPGTSFQPLIAPYWASGVDLENNGGQVFFRETSEQELLTRAGNDVRSRFEDQAISGFEPTSLIIVTWFEIAESAGGNVNTFQCVVATNGVRSFVIFLYPMNGINWGEGAQIGINPGMFTTTFEPFQAGQAFMHPDALTANSVNVETTNNSQVAGTWTFRVDTFAVLEPGELPVLVDVLLATESVFQVTEGESVSAVIPAMILSVDSTESVTLEITLFTSDGSAIGGQDYLSNVITNEITLSAAGSFVSTDLFVQTLEDSVFEAQEEFFVTFNTSVPVLSAFSEITVRILNEVEPESGSGLESGSASGSGFFGGCVDAGFSDGCCTSGSLCRAPAGCYCDQACFSFGNCCPDIAQIGCFDDSGSTPPLDPNMFFRFGFGVGDNMVPVSDDGSSPPIALQMPFRFYRNREDLLYVNTNGVLSFGTTFTAFFPTPFSDSPFSRLIAPFWDDVNILRFGQIFYRITTDEVDLQRAESLLEDLFPQTPDNFVPTSAFIATWDRVAEFGGGLEENSFQVVLASDGLTSFVFFLYGSIEWGTFANIGFSSSVNGAFQSFMVPGALTPNTINIEETSNVGVPGLYIYRVDLAMILGPNDSQIGVFLGFLEPNITLIEAQTTQEVCVFVDGTLNDMNEIMISVFTVDIMSAAEFQDYVPRQESLTFSEMGIQCVEIEILDDVVTENDESFLVSLEVTTGMNVSFISSSVTVIIQDNEISSGFSLPFGVGAGDSQLPNFFLVDSGPINLSIPIKFFGEQETTIFVNSLGCLTFRETDFFFPVPFDQPSLPSNLPIIAPFWTVIDIGNFGEIFYRQTNESSALQQVSNLLGQLFPEFNFFQPNNLFVATWYRVANEINFPFVEDTFQVVLATDGDISIVCFIYGAVGGTFANVGFRSADGSQFFMLPDALNDVADIEFESNVGVPGLYIYRVDLPVILELNDTSIFVGILETNIAVPEAQSTLEVCVFAAGALNNMNVILSAFTIDFMSATEFEDYIPRQENLIFSEAGIQCVDIEILDDVVIENDESFSVSLQVVQGNVTFVSSSVSITIESDDINSSFAFPFGVEAGDSQLPNSFFVDSGPIDLSIPFSFFGELETTIFVNSFGWLTFRETAGFFFPEPFDNFFLPASFPIIAPFWTFIDTSIFGEVFYRQTNESTTLEQVSDLLGSLFPEFNFQPNNLLIATWFRVADTFFFPFVEDTFQVVLATDGDISIVCFIYGPVGGTFANIGFRSADGSQFFMLPDALDDVADIEFESNVGVPGLYIYRVDLPVILELNDPSILVYFEETNHTVNETQSSVEVCVIVQNNLQNEQLTILLFTISVGSATEGEDYEPLALTEFIFTEVESRQCVNITILNDDPGIIEPDEVFEVNFLLISGDAFVFDSLATVTILDDDFITESFFPFGEEAGDELLESSPEGQGQGSSSQPISFDCSFPFYGRQENSVIVNSNGVLSFRDNFTDLFPRRFTSLFFPPGVINPLIAPFWSNIESERFANIWYRLTYDPVCLIRAAALIQDSVPSAVPGFEPKYLFIATWERVAQSFGGNEENTFQVVLATDGVVSYACFVYGVIEWGPFSNIGFYAGLSGRLHNYMLPQALTFDTIDIEFTSNVNEQGLYVYRVDLPVIIELDDPFIYVGFSSLEFELISNESSTFVEECVFVASNNVSIDPALEVTVESLDFVSRAQPFIDYVPLNMNLSFESSEMVCFNLTIIDDNIVEFNEFSLLVLNFPNFKPDLRTVDTFRVVHILDDEVVNIEFNAEEYEVAEYVGDNHLALLACFQLSDSNLIFERSVNIVVATESGTAIASEDFLNTSVSVTYGSFSDNSQPTCLCIQIIQDEILEAREVFFLTVQQDGRIDAEQNISVFINDDEDPGSLFTFINDSPRVSNLTVALEFTINAPLQSVICVVENSIGRLLVSQDCSNGNVTFSDLPHRRQRLFVFIRGTRLGAQNVTDELLSIMRVENGDCGVHAINDGVSVDGDRVMVEWQGTGPSVDNRADQYECQLMGVDNALRPCTSPYLRGSIPPGSYLLSVRPRVNQGCLRRHTTFFEIEI